MNFEKGSVMEREELEQEVERLRTIIIAIDFALGNILENTDTQDYLEELREKLREVIDV
jgi:RecA/RadA recombinase